MYFIFHCTSIHINISLYYRIVGDNWDLEVKSHYQTKDKNNRSLHYFHLYAVADRVHADGNSDSSSQKSLADFQLPEVLPTTEVQTQFVSDLVCLIPRVLVRYATPYKIFAKSIVYHIPHPQQEAMSKKSEFVSINTYDYFDHHSHLVDRYNLQLSSAFLEVKPVD